MKSSKENNWQAFIFANGKLISQLWVTARRIIAYGDNFIIFYKSQDKKVQEKIEFVLDLVRFERKIPKKFFKYLEGSDGIYEIRVRTTFKDLRILCFLDKI